VESVESDGLVCPSCADSVLLFLSCASRDELWCLLMCACVCVCAPCFLIWGKLEASCCVLASKLAVCRCLCRWEACHGGREVDVFFLLYPCCSFCCSTRVSGRCCACSFPLSWTRESTRPRLPCSRTALRACVCTPFCSLSFRLVSLRPNCLASRYVVLPETRPCALLLFRFHVFSVWKVRKVRKPCVCCSAVDWESSVLFSLLDLGLVCFHVSLRSTWEVWEAWETRPCKPELLSGLFLSLLSTCGAAASETECVAASLSSSPRA
jgi:hypothetical protein